MELQVCLLVHRARRFTLRRMIQRDISAEPMTSGAANGGIFSFCEFEYIPAYRPPWEF